MKLEDIKIGKNYFCPSRVITGKAKDTTSSREGEFVTLECEVKKGLISRRCPVFDVYTIGVWEEWYERNGDWLEEQALAVKTKQINEALGLGIVEYIAKNPGVAKLILLSLETDAKTLIRELYRRPL